MPDLLPVIHYHSDSVALDNAEMVVAAGCRGLWLINMSGPSMHLHHAAEMMRTRWPGLWLGVNRLDMEADEAIALDSRLGLFDAVWADNPGLHSTDGDSALTERVNEHFAQARMANPAFRFYGSVAFKTQRPEPEPWEMARQAALWGWVAVTSGKATGVAPDIESVRQASAGAHAAPGGRLALASGISPTNVWQYLPYADDFLVATGISASFHRLDRVLLETLARTIHSPARHTTHAGQECTDGDGEPLVRP